MKYKRVSLFRIWKKFPFATPLLKEYFMCHRVWQKAMPYKRIEIRPEQKFRWNWKINDSINFILFKWNFDHIFTSVQEEYEDHLIIRFENSNQVDDFLAQILFNEENKGFIENTVILQVDTLKLKDPLLNSMKVAFLEFVKRDYKKFLNNVYDLLQKKQDRLQILDDCYWANYDAVQFPENR